MKKITCVQCDKELEENDSFFLNFSRVCLRCYLDLYKRGDINV